VALDGEGYTKKDGSHLYTYVAAATSTGLVADLSRPKGITFEDFADWFLDDLPRGALIVGFSLGYDRTKWVESLPTTAIYGLAHPETRQGKAGPMPVKVLSDRYRVNMVSSLFTIKRTLDGARNRVWDVFKFFQCSFVVALERWGIGTAAEREQIAIMKGKRGNFAGIAKGERDYCQSECVLLARLTRELLDAHEAADLHLRHYYGPGSSAACLLEKVDARKQKVTEKRVQTYVKREVPEFDHCVNSAYFGGRFECSRVGPVSAPIYAYDIASAYPYALARLPCFRHGKWCHIRQWDPSSTRVACVSYRIDAHGGACEGWGPLPHRLANGDIVFPVKSAGGWAWDVELRAGMPLHPGVIPLDAWEWRQSCKCPRPFERLMVDTFAERKRIGKAARGLALKLAMNSCYGKSAQKVGSGAYTCMVRAGLITATCRSMLLRAVAMAKDPWSVLELATDSVLSTEPLDLARDSEYGALGGWEEKGWEGSAFILRPGLRFAPETDDLGSTAARGVGVRVLHSNRKAIGDAWEREPMGEVTVQQPALFHGMTQATRRVARDDGFGETKFEYRRADNYGRWTEPEPRALRYVPKPKRTAVVEGYRLLPWEFPQEGEAARSVAYGEAPPSTHGDAWEQLRAYEEEQADLDTLRIV
jgi:hypothetical protein